MDFEDLKVYLNENEVLPKDLSLISWNLEASGEKYGRSTARKEIEQALSQNNSKESLEDIQQKFLLTEERLDVKLSWLSGERWRASAALGYAKGEKKYSFPPYETSAFLQPYVRFLFNKSFERINRSRRHCFSGRRL